MSSEENSDDRPITVGVIDDDPMICQAMRLILEDYSTGRLNVVFTCTDGGQAVDEAGRHHPDVVLMDVAMPGMDGIEATRRLRALPQPPHVLILTSLSPSGTVERAVEAGAEGFVSKTRCTGGHHPPHHRCVRRSAAIQSIQPTAAHQRSEHAATAIAPGRGSRHARRSA